MEYLKQLFEYAKQPFRFYVMLTAACIALILLGEGVFGVTIGDSFQVYFYIGAVFGAVGVAVVLCEILYRWVKEHILLRVSNRRIERRLRNLTPEEMRILGKYIHDESRSIILNVANGAVADLVRADIIIEATQYFANGSGAYYSISTDHVWAYINANPDLVDIAYHKKSSR